MKIKLTTIFLSIGLSVAGQNSIPDSTRFQRNFEQFINQEFSDLSSGESISRLERRYGIQINSLAQCWVVFVAATLDTTERASLTQRVQEIAKRFYEKGSPIYLSIGGHRSAEWCDEENKKNSNGNLTFVSFGNYCVLEKDEAEFESIFNKKTSELIAAQQ